MSSEGQIQHTTVNTSPPDSTDIYYKDDVESPSLSSSNALARFEFEPEKGTDGTKVLMVEWEDDDTTKHTAGDWEISWEGKRTVLPAREHPDNGSDMPVNRLYFLLGAGVSIPTAVHLRKGSIAWRTNPLPAIFSPELGATARQAGKKGVLHTIWAKKRLQVLQQEIDAETKNNEEGIGLEMAMAEKEWIEQNFGIQSRPTGSLSISTNAPPPSSTHGPGTPRTPGGARLMDKLKTLRLGTGEKDLNTPISAGGAGGNDDDTQPASWHNPLSPEGSDVALGSFAALKGLPEPSSLAAKPAQRPQNTAITPTPQLAQQQRKMVAQRPSDNFASHQRQASGMGSLNAFAAGAVSFENTGFSNPIVGDDRDDDDLFASPLSPRSPEMTKSPFTFAADDTVRYMKQGKA